MLFKVNSVTQNCTLNTLAIAGILIEVVNANCTRSRVQNIVTLIDKRILGINLILNSVAIHIAEFTRAYKCNYKRIILRNRIAQGVVDD